MSNDDSTSKDPAENIKLRRLDKMLKSVDFIGEIQKSFIMNVQMFESELIDFIITAICKIAWGPDSPQLS